MQLYSVAWRNKHLLPPLRLHSLLSRAEQNQQPLLQQPLPIPFHHQLNHPFHCQLPTNNLPSHINQHYSPALLIFSSASFMVQPPNPPNSPNNPLQGHPPRHSSQKRKK